MPTEAPKMNGTELYQLAKLCRLLPSRGIERIADHAPWFLPMLSRIGLLALWDRLTGQWERWERGE